MAYKGQRPPDTLISTVGRQALVPGPQDRKTFYVLRGHTISRWLPRHLQNLVQGKCSVWVSSQTGNSFHFLPWLPPSFPEAFPDPQKLAREGHLLTQKYPRGQRASGGP